MARTAANIVTANRDGVTLPGYTTGVVGVGNGHTLPNTAKLRVHVKNDHATLAKTVSFIFSRTVDTKTVTPRTESIPALTEQVFGDFSTGDYGDQLAIEVESTDIKLYGVA